MPFAYFSPDSSMEEILNVVVKEWKLDFPKIMLLIISDNASLKGWDSYDERNKFVKGLIKVFTPLYISYIDLYVFKFCSKSKLNTYFMLI